MKNPRFTSTTEFVSGVRQLVRGRELEILEPIQLLVESGPVCLDLSSTERIDAAGLAALVSLYCAASEAGHEFSVINPQRQVARVLALVGLDRILVSKNKESSTNTRVLDVSSVLVSNDSRAALAACPGMNSVAA